MATRSPFLAPHTDVATAIQTIVSGLLDIAFVVQRLTNRGDRWIAERVALVESTVTRILSGEHTVAHSAHAVGLRSLVRKVADSLRDSIEDTDTSPATHVVRRNADLLESVPAYFLPAASSARYCYVFTLEDDGAMSFSQPSEDALAGCMPRHLPLAISAVGYAAEPPSDNPVNPVIRQLRAPSAQPLPTTVPPTTKDKGKARAQTLDNHIDEGAHSHAQVINEDEDNSEDNEVDSEDDDDVEDDEDNQDNEDNEDEIVIKQEPFQYFVPITQSTTPSVKPKSPLREFAATVKKTVTKALDKSISRTHRLHGVQVPKLSAVERDAMKTLLFDECFHERGEKCDSCPTFNDCYYPRRFMFTSKSGAVKNGCCRCRYHRKGCHHDSLVVAVVPRKNHPTLKTPPLPPP